MSEERSIIIIGGGIAGLSAGCYGRMNGFHTRIFEMHKKPGGLCTSWKRQGYVVNGCVHWLAGSGPAAGFHRVWEELGAVQGRTFLDPAEYGRIELPDAGSFIVYTDLDRLEREMHRVGPQDGESIREFIAAARRCTRFDPPWEKAPETMGFLDIIRLLVTQFPFLLVLRKWNRITLREFGERFRSPLLRAAFPQFFLPDFPVSFMLMAFAWLHNRTAGYPLGGSLEFSRAIERRYLGLGGEIVYRTRVVKILVETGRAVGVRLDNGEEYRADHIISAADGHETIYGMLDGRFMNDAIRGYYEQRKLIPFPPLVQVALGVNRPFGELPHSAGGLSIGLREPFTVGGVRQDMLNVHVWNADPTLAPPGKSLVTLLIRTDYDYWKRLREDDPAYRAEKERIAENIVTLLEGRFPGISAQIEMRDVATPTTFVRYTGNWRGSFEGWQVTPSTWPLGKAMKRTLPGLANFYMAGHWVEPGGGLPAAAMSGRNVIQVVCKSEQRPFTSTKP